MNIVRDPTDGHDDDDDDDVYNRCVYLERTAVESSGKHSERASPSIRESSNISRASVPYENATVLTTACGVFYTENMASIHGLRRVNNKDDFGSRR